MSDLHVTYLQFVCMAGGGPSSSGNARASSKSWRPGTASADALEMLNLAHHGQNVRLNLQFITTPTIPKNLKIQSAPTALKLIESPVLLHPLSTPTHVRFPVPAKANR